MFKVNVDRVRALLLQSGLPISAFAQKAGLNVLTVKRTLKDDASANIRTIAALAKVFAVEPVTLILKC